MLSWLALRGRCGTCGATIGLRQPLVEGVGLMIGLISAWLVPAWGGWALAVFGWQMLALGLMDGEYRRLPHILTLILAVSGMAAAMLGFGTDPVSSLTGLCAGFGGLWLVGRLYRLVRKRDGLGGGDPGMLGGIGAWLGWELLPLTLLIAAALGLAWAALLKLRGQPVTAATALPFGLMLAIAAYPILALRLSNGL